MNTIEGFQPSPRFFDDTHFPRGFARSGHFSTSEVSILEQYGRRLKALAEGSAQPCSDAETLFVAMAKGQRPAESKVEHAWTKYIAKSQRRKLFTMSSKCASTSKDDEDEAPADSDDLIELD